MGSLLSRPQCSALGVEPNCNFTSDLSSIGGVTKGQFQGDPDIAGIGIVGAFIGITAFALLISIVDVLWQTAKLAGLKKRHSGTRLAARRREKKRISFSDILEALVLSCSDQQVFTGAAYALTLRYYRGCTVSAYHYNIVANMMLLTCATHLMSVAVVQEYWKYPVLALLRILVVTGAFLATGVFLSAQDATGASAFPTAVPAANETASLIFLPATCFENGTSFRDTVDQTFHHSATSPGGRIHGWRNYVAMLIWYIFALLVEVARFLMRGKEKERGWRVRLWHRFERAFGLLVRHEVLVVALIIAYVVGGIAISAWTVAEAALYIVELRSWVKRSGWMQLDNGQNPEDEATTFGQLVPIFLCSLTVFTFCQIISEKVSEHRRHKRNLEYEGSRSRLDLDGELVAKSGGSNPYRDKEPARVVTLGEQVPRVPTSSIPPMRSGTW